MQHTGATRVTTDTQQPSEHCSSCDDVCISSCRQLALQATHKTNKTSKSNKASKSNKSSKTSARPTPSSKRSTSRSRSSTDTDTYTGSSSQSHDWPCETCTLTLSSSREYRSHVNPLTGERCIGGKYRTHAELVAFHATSDNKEEKETTGQESEGADTTAHTTRKPPSSKTARTKASVRQSMSSATPPTATPAATQATSESDTGAPLPERSDAMDELVSALEKASAAPPPPAPISAVSASAPATVTATAPASAVAPAPAPARSSSSSASSSKQRQSTLLAPKKTTTTPRNEMETEHKTPQVRRGKAASTRERQSTHSGVLELVCIVPYAWRVGAWCDTI